MSDWQVGDLAVCVDSHCGHHFPHEETSGVVPVVPGTVYRVRGIRAGPFHECAARIALFVDGITRPAGICCERFRKVVLDKHEACEAEFVTLLKRSKVPTGIPA